MSIMIPDNIGGNLAIIMICGSVFSLSYLMASRLAYPALLIPLVPLARRMPVPLYRLLLPASLREH